MGRELQQEVWAAQAVGAGVQTLRSPKSYMRGRSLAEYDLTWGSVLIGQIDLQTSNKAVPDESSDTDWKTVPLASPIDQPNGVNTGDVIRLAAVSMKWMRLKLVTTGGSGSTTITARLTARGSS